LHKCGKGNQAGAAEARSSERLLLYRQAGGSSIRGRRAATLADHIFMIF
jgi:hypothetical protein